MPARPSERRLRAVSTPVDAASPLDEAREGEAMLTLANAIGEALEAIKSPHWRRLLEPLRERTARAGRSRLCGPRQRFGAVPPDRPGPA